MSDLIDRNKLIKTLSDWQLQESPSNAPIGALEFTAWDMQRMVYRTIRDAISAVQDAPSEVTRCIKCRHLDRSVLYTSYPPFYNCMFHDTFVKAEDFCSMGEE